MTTLQRSPRLAALKSSGLPYAVLLSFFFGTSLISSRFILTEFTSLSYIGLRMLVSCICFIGVFTFSKNYQLPRDKRVWKHGFVLGIIGTTVPMVCFITALNYLSSGVASIVSTVGPALTVVLGHFLLKNDRLTWLRVVGVLMALSGALILITRGETGLGDDTVFNPLGYVLIFTSTISSSFGVIYARRFVTDLGALQVTSVRALVAMAITLPLSYFLYGFDFSGIPAGIWTAFFYSAIISSFAGFILSLYIVNNYGVATSIITNYCVPIVATVGGFLLLNEEITGGMMLGMSVIIAGIYIINSKPRRPTLPNA